MRKQVSVNKNIEKKTEKFGHVRKKSLLCTLFCGSSLKAREKDALRGDMRTAIGATDTLYF